MAENRNAQQVREITDKLEQGLKELFESERFKEYLKTMSKFYNYSFNNTLLIAMQKPDATLIAGYTAWQRNFDRHVMKGEKGINSLEKVSNRYLLCFFRHDNRKINKDSLIQMFYCSTS